MTRAVRSVRSVVASAVHTRGPGGDVRPQVRRAVVEMGDAQMQASDVRHSLVCRMPYTGHAGTKGLCRERRRTGVLPGWRLLSTPCRRPQGDHEDEHVVLRLEEQIVNSRIQRP